MKTWIQLLTLAACPWSALALAQPAAPADALPAEVPRWELHEFELSGRRHVENPDRDAALAGEFTAPSGKTVTVEGSDILSCPHGFVEARNRDEAAFTGSGDPAYRKGVPCRPGALTGRPRRVPRLWMSE
ncbi:MAG: hypothetical protein HZA90_03640, partial [Verrucomicrobia bacterium]|nr:hypothetical protein [Verrucomicrobiota bacterium]